MRFLLPVLLLLLTACGDDVRKLAIAQEDPQANEAEITRELIQLTKLVTRNARDEALKSDPTAGEILRFNQPKHVGCVKAEFSVAENLPAELQVGIFATPQTFPTWIRFANATNQADTEKDFRGMSLKLMQVEGDKLLGTDETQDFILNSHPVLFVGNPQDFRDFVDHNVDSGPLSFFLNPFSPHIKEFRIVLAGRQHHASHLSIPYWSTTPYLFGEGRAVKYSVKTCHQLEDADPPRKLKDGYLREAMREQMATDGACYDFYVQFQTDAELMPLEDATVEWDESLSPARKVARINIPPQSFESAGQMEFCENLAFNPWQSLSEHRPLGGLNRVRKDLYQALADFRHESNGVNYKEPGGDEPF
ncbi:MAG: catalase family protein [Xanthomonadales bacterium]|nr:catalase family protein [Xanthomonadales bacterium]